MGDAKLIEESIHEETGWLMQTWEFADGDTYTVYVDNDGEEHDVPPYID